MISQKYVNITTYFSSTYLQHVLLFIMPLTTGSLSEYDNKLLFFLFFWDQQIDILTYLKREFNVDLQKVSLLTQYNAQRHLLEEKMKMTVVQNRDIFEPYDKFKVNISTVVSSQGMEDFEMHKHTSLCVRTREGGGGYEYLLNMTVVLLCFFVLFFTFVFNS